MMGGLGQGFEQNRQQQQMMQLSQQLGLMKGLGGAGGMGQFGSQKPGKQHGGMMESLNQNMPRPKGGSGVELQGPMMPVGGQLPAMSQLMGFLHKAGLFGGGGLG